MNKIFKLGFFAITAIMLLGSVSNGLASDAAPVITDGNHFVVDRNGSCVRTIFMDESDVCNPVVEPVVVAKPVEVIVIDERVVYFAFDSSVVDDEEKIKLNNLAQRLRDHKIKEVKVVGYTDKIGKHEYNVKLSEKRANKVKSYLDSLVQLDSSPVEIRGVGENNAVKVCTGIYGEEAIKCLAPNRRVEIEVDYYDFAK